MAFVIGLFAAAQKETPYTSNLYQDSEWTVVNVDPESKTWTDYTASSSYWTGSSYYVKYYAYDSKHPADDWLISPGIKLEAGKDYKVKFWIYASSTEELSLKMAKDGTATALSADDAITLFEFNQDLTASGDRNIDCHQPTNTITVSETGTYYFGFHAYSKQDDHWIRINGFEIYEDVFAPSAPTALTVTPDAGHALSADLSWVLPTTDLEGQDLPEGTTFSAVEVYRDNVLVSTLDGTATTFTDTEALGLTSGNHVYGVRAAIEGNFGPQVTLRSKYIGPRTPENLPWITDYSTLDEDDANDSYSVVKGENSAATTNWEWYTDSYYGNGWKFSPGYGVATDDWLLTPELNFEKTGTYRVVTKMAYGYYPTNVDICLVKDGKVAEATVCQNFTSIPSAAAEYTSYLNITEAGTYSIGVHMSGTTEAGSTLYVRNFRVEAYDPTPAAVNDLKVTGIGDFNETLNITWTNPSTKGDGAELTSLTKVELLRDNKVIATLEDVTPGQAMSYQDTPDGGNYYTYKVIPYSGEYTPTAAAMEESSQWVGDPTATLPYSKTTFSTNEGKKWLYKDLNGDGIEWYFIKSGTKQFSLPVNSQAHDNDDVLMSLPFDLDPGYYKVTSRVGGGKDGDKLTLAFVPYNSADPVSDMTNKEEMKLTGTSSLSTITVYPKVDKSAKYRLAFRYNDSFIDSSQPILVRTLQVSRFAVIPTVAENLTVTANGENEFAAVVEWTNPTTSDQEGYVPVITKAVIYRNDTEIATLTENLVAGEKSQYIDETLEESGTYTYKVELYSADGKSTADAPTAEYVIEDGAEIDYTPAAVNDLKVAGDGEFNTTITITWTNPTTRADGGKLKSLTRVDLYRDYNVIKSFEDVTPGQEMSYVDNPSEGNNYSYKVAVYVDEKSSMSESVSTPYVGDTTATLPYGYGNFQKSDGPKYLIYDVNADGNTWTFKGTAKQFSLTKNSDDQANDDVLLSVPFVMEPGYYTVSSKVGGGSSANNLIFGLVPYNTTDVVADMKDTQTMVLNDKTSLNGETALTFKVAESGKYRVAMRYNEPYAEGQNPVIIGNLKVSARLSVIPSVAENLTATAGDNTMTALVEWTNPTTSNQEGLVPDITKAVIYRDGAEIATLTENLVAGEKSQYLDESITAAGTYTYKVELYSADGKSDAEAPSVDVVINEIDDSGIPYAVGKGLDNGFSSSEWTVFNVNGDSNTARGEITWEISSNKLEITTTSKAGDDWVISPVFKFKEGYKYQIEVSSYCPLGSTGAGYPHAITVAEGTAVDPTAMATTLGTINTAETAGNSAPQVDRFIIEAIVPAEAGGDADDVVGDETEIEDSVVAVKVPAGVGTIGFHVTTQDICGINKFEITVKEASWIKGLTNDDAISFANGRLLFGNTADRVIVCDLQGRVVFNATNVDTIDTDRIVKGVYIVRALVDGKTVSFKFVK